MDVRILGCSGGIGVGRRTTSYLLDETILIDAGTGVGDLSLEEMCRIRHIFLTHSHLDHVAALPLLVDSVFTCIPKAIVVHAQPVTIKALKEHLLNGVMWPDFAELPSPDAPVMAYEPLEPGRVLELEGYRFEMFPGDHAVPSVAYRVERDGRSFCFSGDTSTNDTIWEGLNARDGLDLLLVECGFPNDKEYIAKLAKHYTPTRLAADLRKLKHDPKVAITHLQPGHEEVTWAECESLIEGRDLHRVLHGEILKP